MRFTTTFALISTIFFGILASLVAAGPVDIDKRDVFVPKVLYPRKGVTWYRGQAHNVTWDISNVPAQISNRFSVRLRYNGLITPIILADGFDPRKGRVEVTVPWVVSGTYNIVLFGDSGNWSEDFQIQS